MSASLYESADLSTPANRRERSEWNGLMYTEKTLVFVGHQHAGTPPVIGVRGTLVNQESRQDTKRVNAGSTSSAIG